MPRIIDVKADDFRAEQVFTQGRVQKRLRLTYLVDASDIASDVVTEEDILATTGLPLLGQTLRGAYCVSREPKELASLASLWEVACRFDSQIDVNQVDESEFDPEDRTPDWEWDAEMVDAVLECDAVTGKPIVNAVGEPLIITGPVAIPILTITRFEPFFSPDVILNFINRINITTFWGAPAGCAWMSKISDRGTTVTLANGASARYRQVSYQIKFNFARNQAGALIGWKAQPLNHGTKYYELSADPGSDHSVIGVYPFQDKRGNPTTGNLALNGAQVGPSDPTYLEFNRLYPGELNSLLLGPYF